MRVVIVSDFGDVNGGAPKVAIASARGLAEAGVDVIFVCAVAPVSAILSHPRITVHHLGMGDVWTRRDRFRAALDAIWNGRARRALHTILAAQPRAETIVHVHQWTKALSPSVLDLPARLGLPSVVSLHDYFIACPTGTYYRFPQQAPCRLTPMSLPCVVARCDRGGYAHKLVRVLRQMVTRRALARARASLSLLSVSPFAERVIDRFLPKTHARFVARSPIEAPREPPVAVAGNNEFLFIGRLTEEKGVRLLADVAVAAEVPLRIVGDGPLLDELSALGESVRCTGWIDADGVAGALRRARALIFPSTWYETGGLVVLEALARGVPAIVSRTTAPADIIEDGRDGFVIDPTDRAALAARLTALADDATAARMGRAAYDRYWAAPASSGAHTDALIDIYKTILAKHGAERRASMEVPA